MRRSFILIILLMLSLQSCDFIRSRLGLPVSDDFRRYRENVLKAHLDSLKMDSIRLSARADSLSRLADTTLSETYFVVVGSFCDRRNLNNMAELIKGKGFTPGVFEFKNGQIVLIAASFNDIEDAYVTRNILSVSDDRLEKTWIYNIKDNLHKKYNRIYEPDEDNSFHSETH